MYSLFNFFNKYYCRIGASETLRNKIWINILFLNLYNYSSFFFIYPLSYFLNNGVNEENIKKITTNVPVHVKPMSENDFGYYLAGLIDGDGHISNANQLVISFHINDISLAYYIKKRIGYGTVKKVKNKNAALFIISSIKGLEKVLNNIYGKLRHKTKVDQINNILINLNYKDENNKLKFYGDKTNNMNNYWLSGFTDADASFLAPSLRRGRGILDWNRVPRNSIPN